LICYRLTVITTEAQRTRRIQAIRFVLTNHEQEPPTNDHRFGLLNTPDFFKNKALRMLPSIPGNIPGPGTVFQLQNTAAAFSVTFQLPKQHSES
jgi:hypothetical protein